MEAVDESLRLRPGEIRPLVLRGQLRANEGDASGAIEDLEEVIGLIEADKPVEDPEDPASVRQYREVWTIWMTAYHNLFRIHRERDDAKAVQSTLERLKATGDDALMAMGYRTSGETAQAEGRLEDARREYDAALREFEWDHDSRLARATIAFESGDIEGALEDLSHLAPRTHSPKRAIQGLDRMIPLFPDEPRIHRWLGFAHFELGGFEKAEANFESYLERVPEDAEARRWFGLSLISINPSQHDPSQHDPSRDGRRCFRGIEELATAVRDGDDEARAALLWTVDRLILSLDFAQFFLAGNERVLEAVPELKDLLRFLEPALMGNRDYGRRVEAFHESIATAGDLGLPCLVAYLHALLADIYLLIGQLQRAQDHIEQSRPLYSLVGMPRSSETQEQFEQQMNPGQGDVGMELEHVHIYRKADEAIRIVRMTEARVLAMSGDAESAHAGLGDLESILSHVDQVPPGEATVIAQTLRDAGRMDDALAVLDRAEQRLKEVGDDEQRGSVLLARASILAKMGRLPESAELLQQAEPLLDENRRWVAWFNLASQMIAVGAYDHALDVLDRFDIDVVARSDVDRVHYHFMRGLALEGLGTTSEALAASERSIAVLESLRTNLKDLNLRESWAGNQEQIYALAIRVAEGNGDARRAFDLAEQARSRLLVDEMAMGEPVADEAGRQFEEEYRLAEERHELLTGLANSGGTDRDRMDAFVRIKQLDPQIDLVEEGKQGSAGISPQKLERATLRAARNLEQARDRILEHRMQSADRLFGDVVTFDGCRAMLAKAGRVCLIEFVVQKKDTLAFLVRADREEPLIRHVLASVDVREWVSELNRAITFGSDSESLEAKQAPLESLLQAIEESVDPDELICFVPHGPLHLVPLHALRIAGGRLIERNPIVYAPSASVLARVLERPSEESTRNIVVGNTRGDLPFADEEADAVAALLETDPVARRAATRSGLRELLASPNDLRILHLACHGYFDENDALSSGILTSDEKPGGGPGVLSARDLLELHLHADLVALSACETGISEVNPGDELMGLNRALVAGGSRTVLGSLWKVNDYSTSLLMRYFYEGWLGDGLSKADALRAAQCRLMRLTRAEAQAAIDALPRSSERDIAKLSESSGSELGPEELVFASPRYWGAFTLVGDWR